MNLPQDFNRELEIGCLHAECRIVSETVEWTLHLKGKKPCRLHWGLNRRTGSEWVSPPEALWPADTLRMNDEAVQSPLQLTGEEDPEFTITLAVPLNTPWRAISFVLFNTEDHTWIKDQGNNFLLPLPSPAGERPSPAEYLALQGGPEALTESYPLSHGCELAVRRRETKEGILLTLVTDAESPVLLHWGVAPRFRHEWTLPDPSHLPPETVPFDERSCRTPLVKEDNFFQLTLFFPCGRDESDPAGLNLLLYQPETGSWFKHEGRDIFLPLFSSQRNSPFQESHLRILAEEILSAEVGRASWTLMHRYHLCLDLLPTAERDEDAWALLFIWLRFSAIRQLDWQRHYNTKPKDLSHAQDRLTLALATAWKQQPENRWWIRQLIATLGRGGEGQQVRDEILNIMHRHQLKEVRGSFMEEWHQKLHNNTTPDDIVICEAYLAFLYSGGNTGTFWQTLENGGVTRARLAALERPITTDPSFHGDKRDGLCRDFEYYLTILKGVHQGTDFKSAINNATGHFTPELKGTIDSIRYQQKNGAPVSQRIDSLVQARCQLKSILERRDDAGSLRDLLFLDLALDIHLRAVIEQLSHEFHDRNRLTATLPVILSNIIITRDDPELFRTLQHWNKLLGQSQDSTDWALHAKSVADRISTRLQERSHHLFARIQPKAEYLGSAFRVDSWVLPLFSEEVIRGSELFALSLILRYLDPLLRSQAGIGGWQIISPGEGGGIIRIVESLASVQEETFTESTVLITDHVSGDEEIPAGITAIITRDAPDLVSHVAVRARNSRVLFATCYDLDVYERLRSLARQAVHLTVKGADITIEEGAALKPNDARAPRRNLKTSQPSRTEAWIIHQDDFHPGQVGGKSNNLKNLRGRLPKDISLPSALALPFETAERVLDLSENRAIKEEILGHLQQMDENLSLSLRQVREAYLRLKPPADLITALPAELKRAGLPLLGPEEAWIAICKVWAAKWNDRAVLSRRSLGIPHSHLSMAVLIQEVVEADYAYVIHTANPFTGDRDELYAEVVLGMGETLVGNEPGRALSFTCRRENRIPFLHSYPGKATGLYGSGVIFRSDSNGEDLEGFAGAGLYDSYTAAPSLRRPLDYSQEPLVWDEAFRDRLLRRIAETGWAVASVFSGPQDIEGAIQGERNVVVQTRPQVGLDGEG